MKAPAVRRLIFAVAAGVITAGYLFASGSLDAASGLVAILVGYVLGIATTRVADALSPDTEHRAWLSVCCDVPLEDAGDSDHVACGRCGRPVATLSGAAEAVTA